MSLCISDEALPPVTYCTASGFTAGPFIQTGAIARGRVQISVAWIKSIAEEIGLVDAGRLNEVVKVCADAEEERNALATRVERFDEDVANIAEAMAAFSAEVVSALSEKGALERALNELREVSAQVDALKAQVASREAELAAAEDFANDNADAEAPDGL